MGIHERIAALLDEQERDYAWLSRATGIRYKKLLRTAKHGTQPVSLFDAAVIADALAVDLPELLPTKAAAA
jgi:hypothetical protein